MSEQKRPTMDDLHEGELHSTSSFSGGSWRARKFSPMRSLTDVNALRETLKALERIFSRGKDSFWAGAIHSLLDEVDSSHDSTDVSRVSRKVIHLYGGMGSFNDAVIYRNGKYPRGLNNDLGVLRTKLYEIANHLA
ncbi:DUF6966 domain-containing protein [Rathayibacter tritici]|nr:hypothetical protein [Rathayibacter tritici]